MGEAKRKREQGQITLIATQENLSCLQQAERTFMIHNSDGIHDETWEGDQGAFNVTRGYRLAEGPYLLELAPIYEKYGKLEVNRAYAASITFPRLNDPILITEDDDGVLWVIDGRHRIERRHQLGLTTILGMIVPKERRPQIEVSFSIMEKGELVLHTRHMREVQAYLTETKGETHGKE